MLHLASGKCTAIPSRDRSYVGKVSVTLRDGNGKRLAVVPMEKIIGAIQENRFGDLSGSIGQIVCRYREDLRAQIKYHEAVISKSFPDKTSTPKAAHGEVVVHTPTGTIKAKYEQGQIIGYFTLDEVQSIEIQSEQDVKNFARKVGWGTAAFIGLGTVFSGGMAILGAGAALLAAGNTKTLTCLISLKDGKQHLITCQDNIFTEIYSSLL